MEQLSDREVIREAMRRLALARPKVLHVCAECSVEFQGIKRRKYCSTACKNRAISRRWRATHRPGPTAAGAAGEG